MPLPPQLEKKIAEGVRIIEADPQHHLKWQFREQLYFAFGSALDNKVQKVKAWLAVLATQLVLPLFKTVPTETIAPLSQEILDTSILLLNGMSSRETLESLWNAMYHTIGHWTYERDPEYTSRGVALGKTAYQASKGVLGFWENPFERARFCLRSVYLEDGSEYTIFGSSLSDFDLMLFSVGDTANYAAAAYSCSRDNLRECDPQKLQEFWNWWLLEAIPKAWELAETTPN